ncbi:MAG: flagellar assembly protein FliX [Variibacter sp.]
MKVEAKATVGRVATASAARRPSGGETFQVAAEAEARPAAATPTLRAVGGIDALLVLQSIEDPAERRRRSVRRGSVVLDALDALKVSLLAGDLDPAALRRLKASASGLSEGSGEPGLDEVLAAIELRAEVELAKFERDQDTQKRP